MFNRLNQLIMIAVGVLIFVVFIIGKLLLVERDKNQRLNHTVASQYQTITKLNEQAKLNEQLIVQINNLESELRNKADESINKITEQDKANPCYSSDAPRSVVEFLRN